MKFFYYPVCPISTKFRILLVLLKLEVEFIRIASRHDLKLLPQIEFTHLPIFQIGDKFFRESFSILWVLSNLSRDKLLSDWAQNEEIQYRECFFDQQMYGEVYKLAIFEKTQKLILSHEYFPNNDLIKKGNAAQGDFLHRLEEIFSKHNWVSKFHSINDLSCFGFLSAMDYCFMVPWLRYPNLKQWYQRMKSREEYNFIFKEKIINFLPPNHYDLADF